MNQIAEKTPYKIYIYEKEIATTVSDLPDVTGQKYYKERRVAEIGCDEYHSPISARSPKFNKNINGKNSLTFDLHYKYYDEEASEYKINPFIDMVKNETILKLQLGKEWYDLIVTKISKKTDKNVYSITAEDLYITELGKNGFQVELATDLENNMGTVSEIGEYILKNSDWRVAPKIEESSEELIDNNIYSDTIIQTITEPLYQIELNEDIVVERLSQYRPDRLKDDDGVQNVINKGEIIYLFYSDILNKRDTITALYRPDGDYLVSGLDQVVQNSYNYQIKNVSYINPIDNKNLPKPLFSVAAPKLASENDNFTKWRGERVVQSSRTGFNFDLQKPVNYYKLPGDDTEYFGYEETDYISPTLTNNYLSNTCNPSDNHDWYMLDDAALTVKVQDNIYGAFATRYEVNGKSSIYNYGPQGHRKDMKSLMPGDTFIVSFCYETDGFYDSAKSIYDFTNQNIIDFENQEIHEAPDDVKFPKELVDIDLGAEYYNNVSVGVAFCSLAPRSEVPEHYKDPEFKNSGFVIPMTKILSYGGYDTYQVKDTKGRIKKYVYAELKIPNDFNGITDLTQNLVNPLCAIFTFEENKKIYDIQFFRKKIYTHLEQIQPTAAIQEIAVPISNSRLVEEGKYYYDKVYYNQYKKVEDQIQFDENNQPILMTEEKTKYYICKKDLVYPSYVPTETGDLLRSYYYIYTNSYDPILKFRGTEQELIEAGYEKIIQENCEKISSIEKNKSNYYTLLTELTKKFGCWFKPKVIRNNETGEVEYDIQYYDAATKEKLSNEEGNYPFFKKEGSVYKKYSQNTMYKWNKVTGSLDEENNTITIGENTWSLKVFSQLEFEDKFGLDRTALFKYSEVKGFFPDYVYCIKENGITDDVPEDGIGETFGRGIAYFVQLERITNEVVEEVQLEALARPKKYICFCDYINANPNWAGFKYGVNIKSIQRNNDGDKFATKVIVSNSDNNYAKDGFCSIARAAENPTADNFLFNFDYYIANNMVDFEDLQQDLNQLYSVLQECNSQNRAITEEYAALKIQQDIDESYYDTYYMASQTAIQKMQECFTSVANCEHNNVYRTNELDITNWEPYAWQTGWFLEDVYKEEFNRTDPLTFEELSTIPCNGWSYSNGVLLDPDGNEHYLQTGYNIRSNFTFAKLTNLLKLLTNNRFNPISTEETQEVIDYITNHSSDIYYFNTEKAREKLKNSGLFRDGQPDQYYLIADQTGEEERFHVIRFVKHKTEDIIIEKWCEKIDEYYTKFQIYSKLYPNYRVQLNSTKDRIKELSDQSDELVKRKTLMTQWFTDKYISFIRESSWNSKDYVDDNLYYLAAVQNLSSAATPKVSYTLNVMDISQIVGAACFDFTIGDYTYIEDIDFFGIDEFNRPLKEWVVVTEHLQDLDNPSNNSLKIQNYKSSLEDLFSRLSAAVYNLELNQGRYSQYSSTQINSINDILGENGTLKIADGQLKIDNDDGNYRLTYIDKNGNFHFVNLQ